jgi:NAD(P)-dependent dehydrogenase (short-subunit alcohol dehydrogenase family)
MTALAGRVVVVTGGASGLGAAIARRAAGEGMVVIVTDLDEIGATRVADEIKEHNGRAEPGSVDVTREGEVAAIIDSVLETQGRLDALVCSAAIEIRSPLGELADEDWERVLDVNLKGPFLCMKHGIPAIAAQGGGSVVLLGSTLGAIGASGYAAYCASKGALVNLAKQAAIEHASQGVRVNVVSPSACDSGLFLHMAEQSGDPEGVRNMVASRTPMGRLGTEDDVAEAVMYLLGDGSAYLSGAVIPLDGGLAARRTP